MFLKNHVWQKQKNSPLANAKHRACFCLSRPRHSSWKPLLAATKDGAIIGGVGLEAPIDNAHIATWTSEPGRGQRAGAAPSGAPLFHISKPSFPGPKPPLDKVSGVVEVDQLEPSRWPWNIYIHLDMRMPRFHGDFHKQVTPLLFDAFPFPQMEENSIINKAAWVVLYLSQFEMSLRTKRQSYKSSKWKAASQPYCGTRFEHLPGISAPRKMCWRCLLRAPSWLLLIILVRRFIFLWGRVNLVSLWD